MRRLLLAALIALACHGLLFTLKPLEVAKPPRLRAARRPVNLNLAHFEPAAPSVPKAPPTMRRQPPPPKPKPKPEPKVKEQRPAPKPHPKPQPRTPPPPPPMEQVPTPESRPKKIEAAVSQTPPPIDQSPPAAAEVAAVKDPGPPQEAPLVEATPLYADNPPPRYPRSARRRGHQGTVLLSVFVNPDGGVGELKVQRSSGFEILDKAALSAVRQWRFASGRRGDTPVGMWVEVPIRFELQ